MEYVRRQAYQQGGLIMIMWLILNPFLQVEAITCTSTVEGHINRTLTPCRDFLLGTLRLPPGPCCAGVKTLNAQYRTTPARRRACECLKTIFQRHQPGFRFPSAKQLPGMCRVNIGYSITSPNLDCSKIK